MSAGFVEYLKSGRAESVPILPILFRVVADIEGADLDAMLSDPAWLTRILLNAQALFATEAVAVTFEPGRAPEPLLEVITRLASELKRRVPVVARLGLQDGSSSVVGAADLRGLADAACKAGASLILVDVTSRSDEDAARALKPVANTVRYYGKHTIVANAVVPRASADAIVVPFGRVVEPAVSPRVGHHLPQKALAGSDQLPLLPPDRFLFVDDKDLFGLSAPEIIARLSRLRTLRPARGA